MGDLERKDVVQVQSVHVNPPPPRPLKSAAQKAIEKQQQIDADPVAWARICKRQSHNWWL